MGVRFLDLRVRPGGALCHGVVGCGLSLQDALSDCAAFLRAWPSEVIVARVKDEGGCRASARAVGALVRGFIASGDYPLHVEQRLPHVGEVRGRIILLCDWASAELGVRWGGEQMKIQDKYW